jgi:SAM-dependent methyltransferase
MSLAQRDADPCPACESATCNPAFDHGEYSLYRCADCDLLYIHPPPTASEASEIYTDYEGATRIYFTKVGKKMRRARGRVRRIRRVVGGGRFLDIGCSGGFVVEAAREQGFDAFGIDPDPMSIAWAREHYPDNEYFVGFMETFDPGEHGGRPFDAVYCSEVIEHSTDVNGFVAALAAAMAPGAVLYLTTPDISHWRRPREVTKWDAFKLPDHCLYFNPASLARLLARHGIEVTRCPFRFKPGIKLLARKAG